MNADSFKEKQQFFQNIIKQKQSNLKESTTFKETKNRKNIINNDLVKSSKVNQVIKLDNDTENKININEQNNNNNIQKEIKSDKEINNNNLDIKKNLRKIKTQMEQFMVQKNKDKNKDKDNEIIIKNDEKKNSIIIENNESKSLKESQKEPNFDNINEDNNDNDEEIKPQIQEEIADEIEEKQEITNFIENYVEEEEDKKSESNENKEKINNENNIINTDNEMNNKNQEEDKIDENNKEKDFFSEIKKSEEQIYEINTDENNIDDNLKINTDKKNNKKSLLDSQNVLKKISFKLEKRKLADLDIDNFKDFKEEYYLIRKYDKTNYDKGKIFFKYRYLKHKYTQINERIQRLSVPNYQYSKNNNKNINNINNINNNKNSKENDKYILSSNYYLSHFIKNPSEQCLNNIDKDSELRHYHSQFLKTTENSILYFNLKQFEESYLCLHVNSIIKNLKEFGEFLLVGNGFDKFIIGEFLSKNLPPNDKGDILRAFITGVSMNYEEISFLECFRFFMKRFYLPKDANLILVIMDEFSQIYFKTNKNNDEFVDIFKNANNIYLLISTLLALNTMFTRKDIKNTNEIKKEEFISMNKEIKETFLIDLYDKLKIHPMGIELENYSENVYKRMTYLIKNTKPLKNINVNMNNNNINLSINENDDENELLNDFIIMERENIENKENKIGSIDLTKNLYNFNEQDKDILNKIQKFHKFIGNEKKHEREFLVYDNYTKLIWGKNVEANKDKGNLHILKISEIKDVFNGIEHSDILKKYVVLYPKELKEKNHYITINTDKRQIILKSNSLKTALLWYKALKSLVLKVKNENIIKKMDTLNEINTKFKLKLEELWKQFILPNWNIYGSYILEKLKKRNEIKEKNLPTKNNVKSIIEIVKDMANNKILDYFCFFRFFRIGLPQFCRGTIWKILIGNICHITELLYENYLTKIEKVDFKLFDKRYHEDNNILFDYEYNINQMISDVIKEKDYFKEEIIRLNINEEIIMKKCYNILRILYLIRNDLYYRKGIVKIIYVFLLVDNEEFNTFCNIFNLVCNNEIIKFYTEDETFIIKALDLFNNLVKKYLPQIYQHFKNLEISFDLFFIPWITEMFCSSFDLKLLYRIIDLYLIDGEYILYQTGITILSIQEDDLLDLTINEILNLVKRLPDKYELKTFLKKMKDYDGVKNEYIQWKNENELGIQKLQLFQAIFNDDN